MKISLQPNTIPQTIVGAVTSASQSHQPIMPMNRSQSFHFQSPKAPAGCIQQSKKFANKSPTTDHINQIENGESNFHSHHHHNSNAGRKTQENEQVEKKQELEQSTSMKRFLKFTVQNENISILAYSKYGNWFSWCQTCKHGGHIKHLIEWFRSHQKCPFLHCKCSCISIDHFYWLFSKRFYFVFIYP